METDEKLSYNTRPIYMEIVLINSATVDQKTVV